MAIRYYQLEAASKVLRAGNSIVSLYATRGIVGIATDPRAPNTRVFSARIRLS